MTHWDPGPGEMCEIIFPFEVLNISMTEHGSVATSSSVLPEGEVFLILASDEIAEIPAWEFDIMHKSSIYYFNIPPVGV